MRPPDSLPRILPRSMPNSRAILRMDGEVATFHCRNFFFDVRRFLFDRQRFRLGFARQLFSRPVSMRRSEREQRLRAHRRRPSKSSGRRRCGRRPSHEPWPRRPRAVDGIEATAFSFSNSMMAWSFAIVSPSFTKMLTTTPESAPSPSLGSFTSIIATHNLAQTAVAFQQ